MAEQLALLNINDKDEYVTTLESSAIISVPINRTDARWEINVSKPGYTPIMCSGIICGWSSDIITNFQNIVLSNGSFNATGYAQAKTSDHNEAFKTLVLWRRNKS